MKNVQTLIEEHEKELNVKVVGKAFGENKNLHILCVRDFDDSYVAWTAYPRDEGYAGFYNGKYDMDQARGVEELERRVGRELEPNELALSGLEDVPSMDAVIWKVDNGHEGDSFLIDPEDIEERAFLGEGKFLIKNVVSVDKQLDTDELGVAMQSFEAANVGQLEPSFDAYDMEAFLESVGFKDAVVEHAEEFPEVEEHLVFDRGTNEFYAISDCETVKVYEWLNDNNPEMLVLDDGGGVIETKMKVSMHGVSLDEYDGDNFVTGRTGEHQGVYKVLASDSSEKDLYLVEKSSEWSGTHSQGEVMNEEELVHHLESLGRDVSEYMTQIKALDGSVYEPEIEKEVKKAPKRKRVDMER